MPRNFKGVEETLVVNPPVAPVIFVADKLTLTFTTSASSEVKLPRVKVPVLAPTWLIPVRLLSTFFTLVPSVYIRVVCPAGIVCSVPPAGFI